MTAESVTFREIVAAALHGYYCIGAGQVAGEPCLGKDHDIEGWTPVARSLAALLKDAGFAIHREGSCVKPPVVEGREMTYDEEVRFGLRVPHGAASYTPPAVEPGKAHGFVGTFDGACERQGCGLHLYDSIHEGFDDDIDTLKKEVRRTLNPDEFTFGDLP